MSDGSEVFIQLGFSAADARQRARLGLAATRGLLMDLLITGDREPLDAAAELFAHLMTATTSRRPSVTCW